MSLWLACLLGCSRSGFSGDEEPIAEEEVNAEADDGGLPADEMGDPGAEEEPLDAGDPGDMYDGDDADAGDPGTDEDGDEEADGDAPGDDGLDASDQGDPDVPEDWYDPAFAYRKALTVSPAKVPEDCIDFPMLIYFLTEDDLMQYARPDGHDIVFTDGSGLAKLTCEIVLFDPADGQLHAWCKVPLLSGSTPTVLYMYYGNPDASPPTDATEVWTNAYQAIWHMEEDPAIAPPQLKDSTSGFHYGTIEGSMDSSYWLSGKIGRAWNFDGQNKVRIIIWQGADFGANQEFTLSAWINTDYVMQDHAIVSKQDVVALFRGYLLGKIGENSKIGIYDSYGTNGYSLISGTADIADGAWHYVVATHDGSGRREGLDLYRDGMTEVELPGVGSPVSNMSGLFDVFIGGRLEGDRNFIGALDEVRISSAKRPGGWIATEFFNQNDPASFYEAGAQESLW